MYHENAGTQAFRLLDLKERQVLDHVLSRRWTLYLHPRGWSVTQAQITGDIMDAEALVAAAEQKSKEVAPELPDTVVRISRRPPDTIAWQVCDPEQLHALASAGDTDKRTERKRIAKALADAGRRYLPKAADRHVLAVRALALRFPNFKPVIDILARHLRLAELAETALKLPPLLLLGPPGIGKTEFARAVAETLEMSFRIQSMAETSAGFVLTGAHGTWADATPGAIVKCIADCPQGSAPLMLLDEFDKARSGSYHRPDLALLGLLEPTTAKVFRDENLDLCLDARPLSFLLTANRLRDIRPEILSRVRVVEVGVPTQDQMPAIIRSLDEGIRREMADLPRIFAPLGEDVISHLSARPPRALRRLLLDAYALVAERTREDVRMYLRPEDFDALEGRQRQAAQPRRRFIVSLMVDPGGPARVH